MIQRTLSATRALLSNRGRVSTGLVLAALFLLCWQAPARSTRFTHLRVHSAPFNYATVLTPGILPAADLNLPVSGQRYELKLHHLHTGESLDVIYRVGNTYIPNAIAQLDHFLRDHRTQDEKAYDPREFDLLHNVLTRLGKPHGEIDIVCGYRTPWSNNFLRTRGPVTGVALNSQHVQAKAIDIRVPGVQTRRLRDAALSLQAGGVGYYPVSQFVHVDVGPIRQWTFAGRGE